jgi:hypothetical protein
MSTAFYDPSLVQTDRRPKRRWWLWRLLFGSGESERPRAKRPAGNPQEVPAFLRREETGKGDVRRIPGRHYPPPPQLSDYAPAKEPMEEPKPIDPIADLKLLYRTMSYGQFMQAMSAIAGCTQESHDILPRNTWTWATT